MTELIANGLSKSRSAMIASMSGMTYQQTGKIISGIKEVEYTKGSHYVVKVKKEQKEILEKISIELQCYNWAKII